MLNYSEVDMAIGSGVGAFQLIRSIPTERSNGTQAFGSWKFNLNGYAITRYDSSSDMGPEYYAGNYYLDAVLNNASLAFMAEPYAPWSPQSDPGSFVTMTGPINSITALLVTTGDGAEITYDVGGVPCPYVPGQGGNSCLLVSNYEKPNGETWAFHYEVFSGPEGKRLKYVDTSFGYRGLFEYYSDISNQPSKICLINLAVQQNNPANGCAAEVMATTYSGSSVTQPGDTVITYSTPSGLSGFGVKRAGDPNWEFVYSGRGLATYADSVTFRRNVDSSGNGDLYTYVGKYIDKCQENTGCSRQITQNIKTVVSGPGNTEAIYEYDWRVKDSPGGNTYYVDDPLPKEITNQLGKSSTFTYISSTAQLLTATRPEGNVHSRTYGQRGNVVEVSEKPKNNGTSVKNSATYPVWNSFDPCAPAKTCNKPTSITDANGQTTSYTYSEDHGGVLTEVGPADASGVSPAKKSSYGQYYAWLKSGSGFVQAASPVWLLSEERSCLSSALDLSAGTCAAGSGDLVVTSYQYQQGSASKGSNLLLLGVAVTTGGVTRRSCYSYDKWGRRLSETAPKAGLGTCS